MRLVEIRAEPVGLDDIRISEKLSFEMRQEIVNVASPPGFLADLDAVETKPRWIVFDHLHGGMTAPPGGLALNGVEDLQRLHALLHQALGVEHAGALFDVRIWEEDLHFVVGLCITPDPSTSPHSSSLR
jgi:hypothetical protein